MRASAAKSGRPVSTCACARCAETRRLRRAWRARETGSRRVRPTKRLDCGRRSARPRRQREPRPRAPSGPRPPTQQNVRATYRAAPPLRPTRRRTPPPPFARSPWRGAPSVSGNLAGVLLQHRPGLVAVLAVPFLVKAGGLEFGAEGLLIDRHELR